MGVRVVGEGDFMHCCASSEQGTLLNRQHVTVAQAWFIIMHHITNFRCKIVERLLFSYKKITILE